MENALIEFYGTPELMGKHPEFVGFRPDKSVGRFTPTPGKVCPFCGTDDGPLAFMGNYNGWQRMGVIVCSKCRRIFDAY